MAKGKVSCNCNLCGKATTVDTQVFYARRPVYSGTDTAISGKKIKLHCTDFNNNGCKGTLSTTKSHVQTHKASKDKKMKSTMKG